jgi:outer membrane protein assembly factor BamB
MLLGCGNKKNIPTKTTLEPVWQSSINTGTYLCSTIANDTQLFAVNNNNLNCIDFQNGKEIYSITFTNGVENAPVLFKGLLYLADLSGDIWCINAKNGANVWKRSLNTQVISKLKTETLNGKNVVLIPAYDNKLHAFDCKTGETIWEFSTDNFLNAHPAISKDGKFLAFGNCGGTLYILNADGTLHKKTEVDSPLASSPIIIDDKVYVGSHSDGIFCISLATGEILKQYFNDKKDDMNFMSNPVSNKDIVYFADSDSNLHAINGISVVGEKQFFTANTEVSTPPLFFNDYIFLTDNSGMIYIVNCSTKNTVWHNDNGSEILSTFRHKDYIVTGDSQGIITKYKINKTTD